MICHVIDDLIIDESCVVELTETDLFKLFEVGKALVRGNTIHILDRKLRQFFILRE